MGRVSQVFGEGAEVQEMNLPDEVKDLGRVNPEAPARQTLIKWKDNYYLVSELEWTSDTGKPETLIFGSDSSGSKSTSGVAGGVEFSAEQAVQDLVENGPDEDRVLDRHIESTGGEIGAMLSGLEVMRDSIMGRTTSRGPKDDD